MLINKTKWFNCPKWAQVLLHEYYSLVDIPIILKKLNTHAQMIGRESISHEFVQDIALQPMRTVEFEDLQSQYKSKGQSLNLIVNHKGSDKIFGIFADENMSLMVFKSMVLHVTKN